MIRGKRKNQIKIFSRNKNFKKRIKKTSHLKKGVIKGLKIGPSLSLTKAPSNPIISPRPDNSWEAWQTFNPGVIMLNNKVNFIYRAIGEDGISRLGHAISEDGFKISGRSPYPVYEHHLSKHSFNFLSFASGGSFGGSEDPRIVRVGKEDVLYMTYTACDGGLGVGLTSIKVKDFLEKKWRWKSPKIISKPGEVHKNWVIFPQKINGEYAILHSINPDILITYVDNLEFSDGKYITSHYGGGNRDKCWDSLIRGVGAPPIKTKDGWLLLYHAMDKFNQSKYKVGAMLLDLNNPSKILYRSKEPILESTEHYENNGFKAGVIYATGTVIKNGNLLIYYGCADSYICVAYTKLDEFLEALKKGVTLKIKRKILKKKRK